MKRTKMIVLSIVLCLVFCMVQIKIPAKAYNSQTLDYQNYRINETTKKQINRLIMTDSSNLDYLNLVLSNCKDASYDCDEVNQLLKEISSILLVSSFETALGNLNKDDKSGYVYNDSSVYGITDWTDVYYASMVDYNAGIRIVEKCNCPYTAKYMKHAIVPVDKVHSNYKPSPIYHNGDSWSHNLIYSTGFSSEIKSSFDKKIKNTNNNVLTGSFTFTRQNSSLDACAALANVRYVVTFTKHGNSYSGAFKITDIYDFDWNNYNNFAVDFGNNYCLMMQSNRWIREFNITIIGNKTF